MPPRRCSGSIPNGRTISIQGCLNEEIETSSTKSTTRTSSTMGVVAVSPKITHGLPTSPASKGSVPVTTEKIRKTTSQMTSAVETTTVTTPISSSKMSTSTTISHSTLSNVKTESLSTLSATIPMKIEEVRMSSLSTTPSASPAMSHVTIVQYQTTTNSLETEEIIRVTRTLGVELGLNNNEKINRTNPTWFQAIWHIEILAIIGVGWLLCLFFMICGLAVCICKCRTRYSLKAKCEKSEEERKKILNAFNEAESNNREWLQRLFESKRQSREIQMTSCQVQTDRPMTPPRPRTPLMARPDLSRVPIKGILKQGPVPSGSYSLDRVVKENQGVRAKSYHPRTSSIEIPLEKLGPGPKLNQVQFAKEMTIRIISAMDCGCVYNQDLSRLIKVEKDGYTTDVDETLAEHTSL